MSRKERRKAEKLARTRRGHIPGTASEGHSTAALVQRASTLRQAGRLREALQTCREALVLEPERADICAFAGGIALELGDNAEAAEHFGAAAARRADFAEAHYNLGVALRRLGRVEEAAAAFSKAVAQQPDFVQAHANLGNALHALGRFQEAAERHRRVIELMPNSAEGHRNLGVALQAMKDAAGAAAAFRKAIALRPDWATLYNSLAHVLMSLEAFEAAAETCDSWLELEPGSIEALSLKALAMNEFASADEVRYLLDFDRFVLERRIEAPAGFADVAAFNRALAAHVYNHPTLKVPPEDDPTYHHPQLHITEELLVEPKGPIAAFEAILREMVSYYLGNVPDSSGHPFLTHWPRKWRLASWAVVLKGQGNLLPHIHLEGYLSGVYYPKVPAVIGGGETAGAGWLELGHPPSHIHTRVAPTTRRIQPEEGLMLLFPAYFYHRTIPFESAEDRISIAFDVVPEG